MQYGQNISLPYAQQQNDHNNMFNDHKDNILKAKMERDEGKFLLYFFLLVVLIRGNERNEPGNLSYCYSSKCLKQS